MFGLNFHFVLIFFTKLELFQICFCNCVFAKSHFLATLFVGC